MSRAWLVRIEGLVWDCYGSCSSFVLSHQYALRLLSSYALLVDERTYAAQSLDTDVQRPIYSVATVALLPYS